MFCPKCKSELVGIGLPGTTIFNCNACETGWTIRDLAMPVPEPYDKYDSQFN